MTKPELINRITEKTCISKKDAAAALAARDCAENYPSLWDECDEILEKIADKLKDKEPETGELERHFPFYGMNCVHATAESWPFEMTITDVENPSQFVRFYVRKGDTSEIYLPSSHYYVTISTGDIWFGDDIGFGELGEKPGVAQGVLLFRGDLFVAETVAGGEGGAGGEQADGEGEREGTEMRRHGEPPRSGRCRSSPSPARRPWPQR